MYSDVVIATDGSEAAQRAADHGIELAQHFDATVHALSVVKDVETRDRLRADPEGEADLAVSSIEHEATDRDLEVEVAVRNGDPSGSILAYADEVDADAIVMGTTTPKGIGRVLRGSVATSVLEDATVPVLVINERAGTKLATPADAAYRFRCPECDGSVFASESTKEDARRSALDRERLGSRENFWGK